MTKTIEILNYIDELYPLSNASSFDTGKIGLQFGNKNAEIKKVLLALDTTKDIIDEAVEIKANLVISHHPFMFYPMLNLDYESGFGKKIVKIIKNDLNIMAFHTNFDVGANGMNDALSNLLGFKNIRFVGEEISSATVMRIGDIEPMKLTDFIEIVKTKFNLKHVKYVGDGDKIVKTIGIVGGSGSSVFNEAYNAGVDCFITGELPHHIGLEAKENDFALIEVNHGVEFYGMETLKNKLQEKFPNVEFIISNNEFDPFKIQ